MNTISIDDLTDEEYDQLDAIFRRFAEDPDVAFEHWTLVAYADNGQKVVSMGESIVPDQTPEAK